MCLCFRFAQPLTQASFLYSLYFFLTSLLTIIIKETIMKFGINGKYPCNLVLIRKSKKLLTKIIIILLTISRIFFMVDHSLLLNDRR